MRIAAYSYVDPLGIWGSGSCGRSCAHSLQVTDREGENDDPGTETRDVRDTDGAGLVQVDGLSLGLKMQRLGDGMG